MGPEAKLESRFCREIKRMGGLCYKWVSPGCSGVPDRIVIYRDTVWFIEFKSDRGRLSAQQEKIILDIEAQGCKVYVVFGEDGVQAMLNTIKQATEN